VFTEVRGRPAIFWQTQKTARAANPGGWVPRRLSLTKDFTKAGITPGELIVSVNGTATPDPGTLADALAGLNPGQPVTVSVIRPDGGRQTVRVTLGQYPG
jgi:S1-C subfamily serine protease